MTILAALALAFVALQENGTDGPARPVDSEQPERPSLDSTGALQFALGDGVVAVVGRELIRRDDVLSASQNRTFLARVPGLTDDVQSRDPNVRNRGYTTVLFELVVDQLKTVGGRNQGYAPELIQAILDRRVEDLQRRFGGAVGASDALRGGGFDPQSYARYNESNLLRRTWEDSTVGRAPGPDGRLTRDRFVPPGIMQLEYETRLRSARSEERATLGERPQRWVLQQVVLGIGAYKGPEAAREVADVIQSEVGAGKITMESAARQFTRPAERADQWQIEPLTEEQLQAYSRANYGDGALAAWAVGAADGAVSEPFVFSAPDANGKLLARALVVYRVAEIMPATGRLDFEDAGLQQQLRAEVQKAWDRTRTDRGLLDLLEATYVWQPELREALLKRAGRRPQTVGSETPAGVN